MNSIKAWIEAMRLRTLPVSVAGVFAAWALALMAGNFRMAPALLCLVFAVLAQISSNFANEYYDYRDGLDAPGREGPRRGVTEGDITPGAMKRATFATLGAACLVGLSLLIWGGPLMLLFGLLIAAGVVAYSAGPWPLSRHGMGEVAVIIFFGIAPVCLTFFLVSAEECTAIVALSSVALGLMGANVLLVNNYRDADADAAVGKRTLVVVCGRRTGSTLYLVNGLAAVALMWGVWTSLPAGWLAVPALYLAAHLAIWHRLTTHTGRALNPLLGMTAMLMLAYALMLLVASITTA